MMKVTLKSLNVFTVFPIISVASELKRKLINAAAFLRGNTRLVSLFDMMYIYAQ